MCTGERGMSCGGLLARPAYGAGSLELLPSSSEDDVRHMRIITIHTMLTPSAVHPHATKMRLSSRKLDDGLVVAGVSVAFEKTVAVHEGYKQSKHTEIFEQAPKETCHHISIFLCEKKPLSVI